MYVVSKFLDITAELNGEALQYITSLNPRRGYQPGITGNFQITLPDGTAGNEIVVFIERLQNGNGATIDGTAGETTTDLHMDRRRVMRRWTPANDTFTVEVNLAAPQRIGSLIAWLASEELHIDDDLVVAPPFVVNLTPRVTSDTDEGGGEIVQVIGDEAILTMGVRLFTSNNAAPSPDQKEYKITRATSPQKDFFFYGRNLSESWIIGKSSRRSVRHTRSGFRRKEVQVVNMTAL